MKLEYSRRQFRVFGRKTRNGKSKEELLSKIREKQYREKKGASRATCGFIKRRDGGRLKIHVWSANWFGKVEVLQGIQHTNNYRFDCWFVLECFSNWPIFRILNCYCKMFEKRLNNKSTRKLTCNSVQIACVAIAVKIIRFCFFNAYTKAYVNKVFIWESFLSVLLCILIDEMWALCYLA